jgi:hypothetical protein
MLLLTHAASLVLAACSGANTPTPPHGKTVTHFTVADLEELGCRVNVVPRTKQLDMPLVGRVDMYGFGSSGVTCASLMTSMIQAIEDDDPGAWAGARAAAKRFASKHGYDHESYLGEVGDYSEIEVFSRHGVALGFTYNVQAHGRLHSVTLISDSIESTGAFESLLRGKL